MIEIPLTRGKVAIVCECHYGLVRNRKWQAVQSTNKKLWYAQDSSGNKMHRVIAAISSSQIHVDHKDHDGLHNYCENLRPCTRSGNQRNRRTQSNKTSSRYKGVYWAKRQKKWVATIFLSGKNVHLGYYVSEEAAAQAYKTRALIEFGEFACPDFRPQDLPC